MWQHSWTTLWGCAEKCILPDTNKESRFIKHIEFTEVQIFLSLTDSFVPAASVRQCIGPINLPWLCGFCLLFVFLTAILDGDPCLPLTLHVFLAPSTFYCSLRMPAFPCACSLSIICQIWCLTSCSSGTTCIALLICICLNLSWTPVTSSLEQPEVLILCRQIWKQFTHLQTIQSTLISAISDVHQQKAIVMPNEVSKQTSW